MKFLLPLLCLAVLLSGCSFAAQNTSEDQTIALIGPNDQAVTVVVEVADTPQERSQGLMGRAELPENQGMLFLFPQAEPLTFWMKDTYMPLDIIFFNPQGKVIGTDAMVPCEEDPCLRYTSTGPANIALEVNAGFVKQYGIGPEWRIALPSE